VQLKPLNFISAPIQNVQLACIGGGLKARVIARVKARVIARVHDVQQKKMHRGCLRKCFVLPQHTKQGGGIPQNSTTLIKTPYRNNHAIPSHKISIIFKRKLGFLSLHQMDVLYTTVVLQSISG
jgi:hypothetical protein